MIDGRPAPDGMQIHTAPKAIAKRKKIRAGARDDVALLRGSVDLAQEPDEITLSRSASGQQIMRKYIRDRLREDYRLGI